MHLVRRWPVRLSLPCLLSLLGCTASIDGSGDRDAASSPDPCQGVTCNEGFSCLEAACVPADPCEDVECLGEDERCSGGRCSSCQADEDADDE